MVITIGSEKGGVGKSRLVTNIAAMAACDGVDIVLLDTDRQGSAMSWTAIRNEEGVTPSISCLALPANPARELANLAAKYALVLVDIGAQNYRTMLECALLSDIVLVPCGPDQQEIESTQMVFKTLEAMAPRHRDGAIPAHVVLTRVSTNESARGTRDIRELFAEEGISVFKAQIAQREAWRATGKTGRGVDELKGKDRSEKAAAEMRAVYNEIIQRVSGKAVK